MGRSSSVGGADVDGDQSEEGDGGHRQHHQIRTRQGSEAIRILRLVSFQLSRSLPIIEFPI